MMKILRNSLHGLAAIVTIMKKSAIKGEINNDFLQRMIKILPISLRCLSTIVTLMKCPDPFYPWWMLA